VPGWPLPSTSWDWWIFVGIAMVLVLERRALKLRLGLVSLVIAIALGPLYADAVHRWGVVAALGATLVLRIVLAPFGRHRPPPSLADAV
jgi:hypothetical protein